MVAAGVSAAYRVDLSKKIPQLGEDNYLDWLFSISTCFAAMGLSRLLAAGYRGATSGVSESGGVHGRTAGYHGATSGVSESSGFHGRESRGALGEADVSGSRAVSSADSEIVDDTGVEDGGAPRVSRRHTRADPSSSPLSTGIPKGGRVTSALRSVFQTPKRASGSQEQKQESSEVPSAPPLASLADVSAVVDGAGAFAGRPSFCRSATRCS